MGNPSVAETWTPTGISGVLRRTEPFFRDERGAFAELWRDSLTAPLESERFVQSNLSRSRAGVVRGMHFHRHQVDLWVLIEGRAVAVTTDLRQLAADGQVTPTSQSLDLRPGDALFIPRLVAHGFWALDEMALVYFVSNEYDGTDEHGFAWNDEQAAIDWPAGEPILSERDRRNPPLADVVGKLRHEHTPAR